MVFAFSNAASAQKKSVLINRFQEFITGDFDNTAQVVAEIKAGKQIHPLAVHVNRLANDKIKNIPAGLNGFFIIEESYYLADGKPIDLKPYLFLFEEKVHVDFLKPTPLAGTLEIRGRVKEIKGRKVIVETTVLVDGVATARGEVVAVQMPEHFGSDRAWTACRTFLWR